ncbi:hypothetical protein XELAEV_180359921mg, partial [Xenopus laevis]
MRKCREQPKDPKRNSRIGKKTRRHDRRQRSVSCSRNVSGTVGKSVTLPVTLTLPAQRSIQWKFNNDFIATAQPNGIPFYYGAYEGRCHLYENAALQLDNLTPADTGEYTLSVIPSSGATQTEMIYLSVYSAVTSAENVAGTEGKSEYLTVKLDLPAMWQVTWRVNSSTQIVTVSTGGSPIYTDRYRNRSHLYDNTTLRLDNLTPTDTGEFSLTVTNLNNGTTMTGSVYLTVY